MAKVKAIKVGYYDHRRIKVGEIFNMAEVDEKGNYLEGARKGFKCKWVDHVNTKAESVKDPKEVAAVLSGKNPGKSAFVK